MFLKICEKNACKSEHTTTKGIDGRYFGDKLRAHPKRLFFSFALFHFPTAT
jgi:hypothetical protein